MKTFTIILFTLIIFSCGGGSNSSSSSTNTSYTIVEKDSVTTAIDGGYGFEDVAKEMGFKTYTFTEEDYIFYGSPEAKKGGHLKFTLGRFPATFRALGQYYNYTENYYIIKCLKM